MHKAPLGDYKDHIFISIPTCLSYDIDGGYSNVHTYVRTYFQYATLSNPKTTVTFMTPGVLCGGGEEGQASNPRNENMSLATTETDNQ